MCIFMTLTVSLLLVPAIIMLVIMLINIYNELTSETRKRKDKRIMDRSKSYRFMFEIDLKVARSADRWAIQEAISKYREPLPDDIVQADDIVEIINNHYRDRGIIF